MKDMEDVGRECQKKGQSGGNRKVVEFEEVKV